MQKIVDYINTRSTYKKDEAMQSTNAPLLAN